MYKKALSLEQKTDSGLNTLLESWITVSSPDDHGFITDELPDVITPEHRELWEKARYCVQVTLATLKNEALRSVCRSGPLASTRPQSVKRWMMKLVHFT